MRHIYPALFAEVDVDQGQVQPLFGDVRESDIARAGGTDDGEPVVLKQPAGFSEEARVIVDDQAAQGHVGATIAELVTAGVPAHPRLCDREAPGSRLVRCVALGSVALDLAT